MSALDGGIGHPNDFFVRHSDPFASLQDGPLGSAHLVDCIEPLASPQGEPLALAQFGSYRGAILV